MLSLPSSITENTRSQSLARLEEAITILTQTQSSLHSKLDDILSRLTTLETPSPIRLTSTSTPRIKLDIPHFDGAHAMSWIFKILQFFDYHDTPDDERLQIGSFYLNGVALCWFQWMYRNDQLTSW